MQLKDLKTNEIIYTLEKNLANLEAIISNTDEKLLYKTRKNGKWTGKQIIGHLYDTQEVWGQRIAECCLYSSVIFQSYDPEIYVDERDYNNTNMIELLEKYKKSRSEMLLLLVNDNWNKTGTHIEEGTLTVKDLAETIALHEIHHLKQLKEIIQY